MDILDVSQKLGVYLKKMFGQSLHEGIVTGKYFFLESSGIDKKFCSQEHELKRLKNLIFELQSDLLEFKSISKDLVVVIINDNSFVNEIKEYIKQNLNLENSIKSVYKKYFESRSEVKKNFSKYDFLNISEVCRIMLKELDRSNIDFENLRGKILVSHDLRISQFLEIIERKIPILGVILEKGVKNSYLSSLLKAFGIPSLINVNFAQYNWKSDDEIILDSRCGFETITIDPSEKSKAFYERSLVYTLEKNRGLLQMDSSSDVFLTKDGKRIYVDVSILHSGERDLLEGLVYNGLGLLRTESFFLMSEMLPNQDGQLKYYKSFLPYFKNKKISIMLANFGIEQAQSILSVLELDPLAAKLSGTRFLLQDIEFLKTQLKAILRFSSFGETKIVYPFVSNANEVIQLNKVLETIKDELIDEGYTFNDNINVVCAMETPSSAIVSDKIIDLVDEMLIDIDMLTQNILVADRSDPDMLQIFDSLDPAVLRAIKMIVDAAINKGKRVSAIGELAHTEIGIVTLLVLGIKHFSVAPKYLNMARWIISKIDLSKLDELKNYVLNSGNADNNRSIANLFVNDLLEKR